MPLEAVEGFVQEVITEANEIKNAAEEGSQSFTDEEWESEEGQYLSEDMDNLDILIEQLEEIDFELAKGEGEEAASNRVIMEVHEVGGSF